MTTETISMDHTPRFRVLIPSTASQACEEPLDTIGWAALANILTTVAPTDTVSVSPGILAAVGTIQKAMVEIIRCHPEVDGTALIALDRALHPVRESMDAAWPRPRHLSRSELVVILSAQLANPALVKARALYGAEDELAVIRSQRTAVESHAPAIYEFLQRPARACPDSLDQQINWILEQWGTWLSAEFRRDALRALDVYAESHRPRFGVGRGPVQLPNIRGGGGMGGPGDGALDLADIYGWGDGGARFSDDSDWMSELVLVAKHTYVWLDQLSKRYERSIQRLDEIPEEALRELAERGFTGLWLIGLWERSHASKEIKRRRGNHEAEASAYSLYDYAIAHRLGGEGALTVLREKAKRCGLRLAADMVPNHVGVDGRWVIDHPERFVQVTEPPFPGYGFNGPSLSQDDRVGIYLEDGYWTETDAAVCFKWEDRQTGQVRYIYHGNDGTQMPWNDTAQLDYLQPEVREMVIQTIVDVARRFPVIRFDAAMTLARRHIERLWYPAPGHGGAIPSRAENSVSPEVFARLLPKEFWAEVVDRIKAEVPDTLLLAEAFWMMESYFVRTLGMHRVYNSAFMHMLRDQDNGGYRNLIKEILEYNPAILDRFVNFMNNPDEDTAVDQFGKGDKYFGVATLMATLPGLPMFGHGQFEGYAEKYGMEFARAYWDEQPDQGLLNYHARVITPLLKARDLFCGVEHFALYDLRSHDGAVVESVFAYSNRSRWADRRSLVLYNNAYDTVYGQLKMSSPVNAGSEAEPYLVQRSLGDALGLKGDPHIWYAIRTLRTGEWYLRSGRSLHEEGMGVILQGYEAQVFIEFQELEDHDGRWAQFAATLNGASVANIFDAFSGHWAELDAERFARERGPRPYPDRCAGVLLHPTSLAGPEGIGTIGQPAINFLDWLQSADIAVWQVLPLCPGGAGRSPYSSSVSLIGNPLLIDLALLVEQDLLTDEEYATAKVEAHARVNYGEVESIKMDLLRTAAQRFLIEQESAPSTEYASFLTDADWLDDALLFMCLKDRYQDAPWTDWPEAFRDRQPEAMDTLRAEEAKTLAINSAIAFFFDMQWAAVRRAAEERGISIFGDLPIYVAHDSADVWANRDLFELTETGERVEVAAVPPDAFSATGQLWGNPLYDWGAMASDGYDWWVRRIQRALEWTPLLRLDHFRGFSEYYSVEGTATIATEGRWRPGPGLRLFNALDRALGVGPFIAEDLGLIGPRVHALRDQSGMLGMRVLQFGVAEPGQNLHHPANCPDDVVVYTGTHDNDTSAGWFQALDDEGRSRALSTLGCADDPRSVCDALVESALRSPARLAVVPAQDILGLGSEGRMNTPGEGAGQWNWRLLEELDAANAEKLAGLVSRYGRSIP